MAKKAPSKEDLILERLERMEEKVNMLAKAQAIRDELREDMTPLIGQAFRILMQELGDVETGFQLEDLFIMLKRTLRSMRNIAYALESMENLIELWQCMEPLLKSTVPNLINYFDNLERRGVFRTYAAMLEVRAKVATAYKTEEIAAMGEGFVSILGILKKLSHPGMVEFLNRLMDIPLELHLEEVKPVSTLGLLSSLNRKETREGIAVMLELTKALGKLKGNGKNRGQLPVASGR
ncbi:MAG: DUF1641 domain-containing protein [Deltaproteobacteria bacterium]|nr:DUF1641 domain-containing protein [Deltaproteobacteria bacterium]